MAMVCRLAEQVRSLHGQGRLHRAIGIDAAINAASVSPCLADPPEVCRFGGRYAEPDRCPPELIDAEELAVPSDRAAAAAVLRSAGLDFDPRRIDVFQLAALLIRVLSGASVSSYLSSPKSRAAIPPALRSAVDRALGHCSATRMQSVDELLGELSRHLAPIEGETPATGHQPTTARSATPPSEALPFLQLDRYRLLRRIGRGGMGDVYLGHDDSLARNVAVKVLPAELSRDESFVRRFRTEASAAAQVTHPNVVRVYLIGEEAGRHFFVMEWIDGESLAERLGRLGRFPPGETLDILEQCLAGLAAAHGRGLIHRDVKPANILLDRESGRAVVADFGLAHRMSDHTRLTATGTIMGTVDYIAPEQATGAKVDARADIYALGVIAYQMLSGRLPHEADSPTGVLYQHIHLDPVALEEAAPDVPAPLCRIVARMMAKQPQNRYQNCAEVIQDLRAFRGALAFGGDSVPVVLGGRGEPASESPTVPARAVSDRKYRPGGPAILAGGLIAAVACAAVLVAWRQQASVPVRPPVPEAADKEALPADAHLIDPRAGEWVSLLEHYRPEEAVVWGEWSAESDGLRVKTGQGARMMLPVTAADGDYSLEVSFTRNAGEGSVVLILPAGSEVCELTLHGWDGIDGIEVIDGKRANENATTRTSVFENLKRYLVQVNVHVQAGEAAIDVLLNGEPYMQWQGKASLLACYFHWNLPDPTRPGLGAWSTDATFHSMRFRRGPAIASSPVAELR
ncbi:MAG: serine/threonine protein kinase [Pirellulales bacterium]|nr:serine/threonine protein kinase [Pirellulales bacterium]